VFFEHVNFRPRASKAQNFYFLQNGPYNVTVSEIRIDGLGKRTYMAWLRINNRGSVAALAPWGLL
jgi:hypothetical protein